MKTLYFLLLISLTTFAQNNLYEIEYVCTRTLNFKVQTNDILYFDVYDKISYYKEGEFITVEKPDLTSLPSNAILVKEKNIANKSYVYTSFKETKVVENTKPYQSYYLSQEVLPQIDWHITNETKSINGIDLTKALTTFRGRKYEVWFSYEYPLSIGPWKFQGLPGLIFEVNDLSERFTYQWRLKKISTQNRPIPFSEDNIKNAITPQKLLENFKDEQMNETDIIMSRAGVDFEPIPLKEKEESFNNYRLLKREIKYEWEE